MIFKIENNLVKYDEMITSSKLFTYFFKICKYEQIFNLKNKFELIRKFEISDSCLLRRK